MNKDIDELLPFYINGSLDDEERLKVESALKADPALKQEISFLQKLREEVKTRDMGNPPGELGLKRLQKTIAEDKLKKDPVARARSKITKEQNLVWKLLAVTACLLLVIQTILFLPSDRDANLTAAQGPQIVQQDGRIIKVTFSPEAREENIRNLLLTMNATIIDGPSALGVYKLSVPRNFDQALEKLRAHKSLVDWAESETAR